MARILGIDPGLRNVGLCVMEGRKVLHHDTFDPGGGIVSEIINQIIFVLKAQVTRWQPTLAAVEQVVWQGRRNRNMIPLAGVAGAIAGYLVGRGIPTYVLTPSMKADDWQSPPSGWTEHDRDARALAITVHDAVSAELRMNVTKKQVDKLERLVGRCVHG